MSILRAYFRLYLKCFTDALSVIGKNAWTLLLPMGLALALSLLGGLFSPLGMAGGFLGSLARTAAFSVFTSFVADLVARQKVSVSDLKNSLGAYFWAWMNVFFVLWIVNLVLNFALGQNENKGGFLAAVFVLQLVALNAVPEIIYLKRPAGGLDTVKSAVEFLQEHWIEWFVPNGVLLAVAWFTVLSPSGPVLRVLGEVPFGFVLLPLVAGAVFHLGMVFRGFLFQALDGSTHRQRLFKYGRVG